MTTYEIVALNERGALEGKRVNYGELAQLYEITGTNAKPAQRAELQGQPKLSGLYGPMWGGYDENGAPVIRYESPDAYRLLST